MTKRKPFSGTVELRVKSLLPIPYTTLMLLTLAKEVEAYFESSDRKEVGSHEDEYGRIDWPSSIRQYFVPNPETDKIKMLKRGATGDSRSATLGFVIQQLDSFLSSLSSFGIGENELENCPLYFFKKFVVSARSEISEAKSKGRNPGLDEVCSHFSVELAGSTNNDEYLKLKELNFPHSRNDKSNWIKVTLELAPGFDGSKSEAENKQHLHNVFDVLSFMLKNYLLQRDLGDIENRYGHSKNFPGIGLHRAHLLASQYLSLPQISEEQLKITGFFGVLREARGTITNFDAHRNCIVRDLLWLRPHRSKLGPDGIEDFSTKAIGCRLGYYFSAFDCMVYEIKKISLRDDYLMIDAVAHMDHGRTKSWCGYFPLMPNSRFLSSMGAILGHAHDSTTQRGAATWPTAFRRVGGWSSLFYRLGDSDAELSNLQNLLSIYSESLRLDVADEYDRNIEFLFDFVDKLGMVGVLFSEKLFRELEEIEKKEEREEQKEKLINTSKYFRDFFSISDDYMRSIRRFLDEKVDSIYDDREKLKKFIEGISVEQMMYCITPKWEASMFANRFEKNLIHLSKKENIMSARKYRTQHIETEMAEKK